MRHLKQTGDTIVEVLIAIAVISLVLVGAYVSTNKNIASTQDAQERSQAVKLAETQIELVRSRGAAAEGKCLSKKVGASALTVNAASDTDTPCTVNNANTVAGPDEEPAYTMKITRVDKVYTIEITWTSITDSGQNNVKMYYAQPGV